MATAILTNDMGLPKEFRSKIERLVWKKEFSMMKRTPYIQDLVSAKERLSVPFKYRWMKFTNYFRKLTLQKGIIL